MNGGKTADRKRRVVVRVHASTLVVAAAVMLVIAVAAMPRSAPGYPAVAYAVTGVVMGALLLASILAHELGHAVVARRLRASVRRITLGLDGGSTELAHEPATPKAEFLISAAGPAVTVIATGAFLAAAAIGTVLELPLIVLVGLVWLAILNGVLAVANVLPGRSTDGAGMLYAALWHHHGDPARAAATVERVRWGLGGALLAAGLVLTLTHGIHSGLWPFALTTFLINPRGMGR